MSEFTNKTTVESSGMGNEVRFLSRSDGLIVKFDPPIKIGPCDIVYHLVVERLLEEIVKLNLSKGTGSTLVLEYKKDESAISQI